MAKARVPSAFAGFTRLSASNYAYEPPSTRSSSSSNDPNVILLLSWMDAAPKHIAKYIDHYKTTYPHARILLITTTGFEFLWRTKAADLEHVNGVATILETLPDDSKVLLHSLSNGGGCATTTLALEYRKRKNAPLPVNAMVLDSCPGVARYWRGVTAMAYGLPQGWLAQFFGKILLHIFLSTYTAIHRIFFIEDVIQAERRLLNTETLFSKDVPRLYVYSETDKIVYWKDIEAHAQDAKKLGYEVETLKVEGSGHAAHMMKHPTTYWEAVTKLWKELW